MNNYQKLGAAAALALPTAWLVKKALAYVPSFSTAHPDYPRMKQPKPFRGNVIFKEVSGSNLRLDVYRPEIPITEKLPVVIYIHGGSWTKGSKIQVNKTYKAYVLRSLLDAGVAVISINYRLANGEKGVNLAHSISDCKDAVRWTRRYAAQLGLDADRIALWGSSAGAHLAMMAAYSAPGDFLGDKDLASEDVKVKFLIDNYGPTDLNRILRIDMNAFVADTVKYTYRKMYRLRQDMSVTLLGVDVLQEKWKALQKSLYYSPITHIDSHSVPALILHGTSDHLVRPVHAKILAGELKKNKVPFKLYYVKGAQHGFANLTVEQAQEVAEVITAYVKAVL